MKITKLQPRPVKPQPVINIKLTADEAHILKKIVGHITYSHAQTLSQRPLVEVQNLMDGLYKNLVS